MYIDVIHARKAEPSRTAWHSHAVGQTLYATEGIALYEGTEDGGDGATWLEHVTQPADAVICLAATCVCAAGGDHAFHHRRRGPAGIVTTLRDALPAGSYLVISHASGDFGPQAARDAAPVYDQATSPPCSKAGTRTAGHAWIYCGAARENHES